MSRYYMHVRGAGSELLDPEGSEFSDLAAVRKLMLTGARELIGADAEAGVIDLSFRIDAEDEAGCVICSLLFSDAVTIRHPVMGRR